MSTSSNSIMRKMYKLADIYSFLFQCCYAAKKKKHDGKRKRKNTSSRKKISLEEIKKTLKGFGQQNSHQNVIYQDPVVFSSNKHKTNKVQRKLNVICDSCDTETQTGQCKEVENVSFVGSCVNEISLVSSPDKYKDGYGSEFDDEVSVVSEICERDSPPSRPSNRSETVNWHFRETEFNVINSLDQPLLTPETSEAEEDVTVCCCNEDEGYLVKNDVNSIVIQHISTPFVGSPVNTKIEAHDKVNEGLVFPVITNVYSLSEATNRPSIETDSFNILNEDHFTSFSLKPDNIFSQELNENENILFVHDNHCASSIIGISPCKVKLERVNTSLLDAVPADPEEILGTSHTSSLLHGSLRKDEMYYALQDSAQDEIYFCDDNDYSYGHDDTDNTFSDNLESDESTSLNVYSVDTMKELVESCHPIESKKNRVIKDEWMMENNTTSDFRGQFKQRIKSKRKSRVKKLFNRSPGKRTNMLAVLKKRKKECLEVKALQNLRRSKVRTRSSHHKLTEPEIFQRDLAKINSRFVSQNSLWKMLKLEDSLLCTEVLSDML